MPYQQLRHWACCQLCGRVTPADQALDKGWLVSPFRDDPTMNVVRCPPHISEWALRRSQAGRTKEWRRKMAEGQQWTPPPIPPHLSPFPMTDTM